MSIDCPDDYRQAAFLRRLRVFPKLWQIEFWFTSSVACVGAHKKFLVFLVFSAMSLISACSTMNNKPTSPGQGDLIDQGLKSNESVFVVPLPKQQKAHDTPVVRGLLKKSKKQFDAKQFDAAANYLERGINISPNSPMLWQRLAEVRFEQGNYRQAKQLASRSNIFVGEDQKLRAINSAIIRRSNRLIKP